MEISRFDPFLVVGASVISAALLAVCRFRSSDAPAWCAAVSAASLAALAPLANESAGPMAATYLALLFVSVAVALAWVRPGLIGELLLGVLTAGAVALDPTSLIWPAGYGWASLVARRWRRSLVMVAATAVGLSLWLVGGRAASPGSGLSVFGVGRDLALLTPVLLLGGLGWIPLRRRGHGGAGGPLLAAWGGVAIVGIVLALLGVRASVVMLVLPFWWSAPRGLALLGSMLGSARSSAVGRFSAVLAVIAVVALAVPAAQRWADGVWLALYPLLA